MADYGHELALGSFITPTNAAPEQVVELARVSEQAGLDLVTFQDHPYQPGFLDTWTLLSYVAARTERIHISANVVNLPLRPPAVLARAAASLDLLSGGRLEMGLGAGAFWDGIEGMGGRRLTPGQGVEALSEAIDILRGIWDSGNPALFRLDGIHYQVGDAQRGPAPAHDIGIWLGAYKPRMLRLTGRKADGWLPSLGYLKSLDELATGNATIDAAAEKAGRDPRDVRRMLNITGRFGAAGQGLFSGPPEEWVEQLASLTLSYGFSTYILGTDEPHLLRRFGEEVAPALREIVAVERRSDDGASAPRRRAVTAPGRGGGMRMASGADPEAELSSAIDYATIPAGLRGKAYTPREEGYDDVRSTYMAVGRPGLVVMAESADDVSEAVRFAATQDVPLSVRSGGHGIAGTSTNDGGIVLDVSGIDALEVLDPAARRFKVGAGATWGHVAEKLAGRGWAMTSGNYGDVGVGGLATAGGIGYLARKHGLTLDHVTAAEIVLADGSQVRADAEENSELFWAVRGAGANFGVVTSLELEAIDLTNVVFAVLSFDASDTAGFLQRWGDYLAAAPRELTCFMNLSPARAGQGPVAQALCVWAGDDTDAAVDVLEPMLGLAPVLGQQAQLVPYSALVAPLDNPHTGQQTIQVRNAFLPRFDPATAEAVSRLLDERPVLQLEIRSVGGAVSDVDVAATAFAHRSSEVFISAWGAPGMPDALDRAWSLVAPCAEGLYSTYTADLRPERVQDAFPGPTYERLLKLKRRYDPQNLFRRNMNIDPAAG